MKNTIIIICESKEIEFYVDRRRWDLGGDVINLKRMLKDVRSKIFWNCKTLSSLIKITEGG